VLGIKMRAGLLGLVAMLMLGAFSAAPAFAEGGPFCHHRAVGEEGNGAKITEAAPEQVLGEGLGQKLTGKVLGLATVINAVSAEVKGVLYNNPDQCQSKITITYHELSVEGMPDCVVTVNSNNTVKLYGHQAWKWNGTKTQLEEKSQALQHRDWIFLPVELPQGATGLPTGETPYATITLTNKSEKEPCAIKGFTQEPVTGSATAEVGKQALKEWSLNEEQITRGGAEKQHFWNGAAFIGVETGLKFAGTAAKYEGVFKVKTIGRQGGAAQEVAYFEE
jgi:hypothetical protein